MSTKMKIYVILCLTNWCRVVNSHGMVMDPVNRGSRWRVDRNAGVDYADNEQFCGGFNWQWKVNKGKCGLCGDPYTDPMPRKHEDGGQYGQGVIVKTYKQDQIVNVTVRITSNHEGFYFFRLCNMDKEPESDECFDQHHIVDDKGEGKFKMLPDLTGDFDHRLKLPPKLKCKHCVLQWTYIATTTHENFRSCSDIKIQPKSRKKNRDKKFKSDKNMKVKIIKRRFDDGKIIGILKDVALV